MGDDLVAARTFVDIAHTHLDILLGEKRSDKALARRSLIALRAAAVRVHARAILRSGQRALDLIEDNSAQPKLDGAFMSLNKLVVQYRQGLEEVENAMNIPASKETHIQLSQQSLSTTLSNSLIESHYKVAQQTLAPLLPFLSNTDDRQAVEFLAGMTPLNSGQMIDFTPLTATLALDQNAGLTDIALPASHRSGLPKSGAGDDGMPKIAFETLMPGLTNAVLVVARQSDKTVSLGYSDNDIMLPGHLTHRAEVEMHRLGRFLVRNVLEARDIRSARGDSQSGQILITAKADKEDIIIQFECAGRTLSDAQKNSVTISQADMQLSCAQSGSVTRLTLRLNVKMPYVAKQDQANASMIQTPMINRPIHAGQQELMS